MDAYDFGKFVYECRKEQGLSQTELGEKVSVTGKAVSRWERGVGYPDITLLEPLSEALGVTIMELMKSSKGDDSMTSEEEINMLNETITYLKKQKKVAKIKCSIVCVLVFITVVMGDILACRYVDNLWLRGGFIFLLTWTGWSSGFLMRSYLFY
ncbi:helix-turn-helix domain-containing protein [Pseudobutyrivibrio sp.]|jgi:transcriptional regulator with XRE-family HTH domain|uniref:helix-turn-helix domain-containing protein n=1 Tax=Pseudobutyrivibrio sp. TaxID=2014367 RepID=UPI0025F88C57|nr:helix-turn-helix transcriptional regulator [Pseudobutyrivibrio sp.]